MFKQNISEVNDIFKELAAMVHDQGEIVDSIEANVEKTEVMVEEGASQLRQASNYSVSLLLYIKLLLLCIVYVCVCVHMHAYLYTHICSHTQMYICIPPTHIHACTCVYNNVYFYSYTFCLKREFLSCFVWIVEY